MSPRKRTEQLFDQAKSLGLVNPITGDGMPTIEMVVNAILDAESDVATASIPEQIEGIQQVLKTCREDGARLDWLDRNASCEFTTSEDPGKTRYSYEIEAADENQSIRDAVDTARKYSGGEQS